MYCLVPAVILMEACSLHHAKALLTILAGRNTMDTNDVDSHAGFASVTFSKTSGVAAPASLNANGIMAKNSRALQSQSDVDHASGAASAASEKAARSAAAIRPGNRCATGYLLGSNLAILLRTAVSCSAARLLLKVSLSKRQQLPSRLELELVLELASVLQDASADLAVTVIQRVCLEGTLL